MLESTLGAHHFGAAPTGMAILMPCGIPARANTSLTCCLGFVRCRFDTRRARATTQAVPSGSMYLQRQPRGPTIRAYKTVCGNLLYVGTMLLPILVDFSGHWDVHRGYGGVDPDPCGSLLCAKGTLPDQKEVSEGLLTIRA